MKTFDIIIGNPPYQLPSHTSVKLWQKFILKAKDLVVDGGIITMVVPKAWTYNPKQKVSKDVVSYFLQNHLSVVSFTSDVYFNKIGESTCYFILNITDDTEPTTLVLEDGTVEEFQYTGDRIGISENDEITFKILKHIENYEGETINKYEYRDTSNSHLYKNHKVKTIKDAIKFGLVNTALTSEFSIPVYWTAANTNSYFIKPETLCSGSKVIINRSGYYYHDDYPTKYMRLDNSNQYAIGDGAYGIPVDSDAEGNNILSFLKSKLYRFYVDNEKTGGYNTGIRHLPFLDKHKLWDDTSVYIKLGIDKIPGAIRYIEDFYK